LFGVQAQQTGLFRAAARNQPIPPPSEPEWYSVFLIDEETGSEFFMPWSRDYGDALAVEVVERGANYRVESASALTRPPGPCWTLLEKSAHPAFKSQYRRVRRMFWSAA
jgi:hypothetical protein